MFGVSVATLSPPPPFFFVCNTFLARADVDTSTQDPVKDGEEKIKTDYEELHENMQTAFRNLEDQRNDTKRDAADGICCFFSINLRVLTTIQPALSCYYCHPFLLDSQVCFFFFGDCFEPEKVFYLTPRLSIVIITLCIVKNKAQLLFSQLVDNC